MADLYLHIVEHDDMLKHVTQHLLKDCWTSELGNCMIQLRLRDGKWYRYEELPTEVFRRDDFETQVTGFRQVPLVYDEQAVLATPSVLVGEVAAMMIGTPDSLVLSFAAKVADAIGRKVSLIDEAFIRKVEDAFSGGGGSNAIRVAEFLAKNKGKRCFPIYW